MWLSDSATGPTPLVGPDRDQLPAIAISGNSRDNVLNDDLAPSLLAHNPYHAKPSSKVVLGPCTGVQVSVCALFCLFSVEGAGNTARETSFAERIQDLPLGALVSLSLQDKNADLSNAEP